MLFKYNYDVISNQSFFTKFQWFSEFNWPEGTASLI